MSLFFSFSFHVTLLCSISPLFCAIPFLTIVTTSIEVIVVACLRSSLLLLLLPIQGYHCLFVAWLAFGYYLLMVFAYSWLLVAHGCCLSLCGYYCHYLSFKWFWLLLLVPFICDYCHFLLLVIANFFSWQSLFLTNHHCCFSLISLLWIVIVITHVCFQHGTNLGVQAR